MLIKIKNRGFTLVELLVVISIIGLLSTMATAALNSARKKSKIAKALHDTDQIFKAISMMGNDTGYWPGHQEIGKASSTGGMPFCDDGCAHAIASSSAGIVATDGTYSDWGGPYMKRAEIDAWGSQYFFDTGYQVNIDGNPCDGGGGCIYAAVVGSYGPDGVGNGSHNADDIIRILAK